MDARWARYDLISVKSGFVRWITPLCVANAKNVSEAKQVDTGSLLNTVTGSWVMRLYLKRGSTSSSSSSLSSSEDDSSSSEEVDEEDSSSEDNVLSSSSVRSVSSVLSIDALSILVS